MPSQHGILQLGHAPCSSRVACSVSGSERFLMYPLCCAMHKAWGPVLASDRCMQNEEAPHWVQ